MTLHIPGPAEALVIQYKFTSDPRGVADAVIRQLCLDERIVSVHFIKLWENGMNVKIIDDDTPYDSRAIIRWGEQ